LRIRTEVMSRMVLMAMSIPFITGDRDSALFIALYEQTMTALAYTVLS